MSTIERLRASRSKGLALAAVIAGVGRYLEDVLDNNVYHMPGRGRRDYAYQRRQNLGGSG